MQLTYTLTPRDYLQLHARSQNQYRVFRVLRLIRWILIPALALPLSAFSPLARGDWKIIPVLALAMSLLWSGLVFGMTRRAALQEYVHRPGALAARVIRLSLESVSVETEGTASTILWGDVSEVAEERGYLVFRASAAGLSTRHIAFFVPVRAFASLIDAEAFLTQAQTHRRAARSRNTAGTATPTPNAQQQVSASYSLMSGEVSWMIEQRHDPSFYKAARLGSFAGLLFILSVYMVSSGRWDITAVLACVLSLFVVIGRRGLLRGPIVTGAFRQFAGNYRITLLPAGLEQHSPAVVNWISWPVITRIEVKRRYFLFHSARSVFCVVPPSAFGSADEAEAFLNTARAFHQSALNGEAAPEVEPVRSWPPPPRR